jgi:hypothetical protein
MVSMIDPHSGISRLMPAKIKYCVLTIYRETSKIATMKSVVLFMFVPLMFLYINVPHANASDSQITETDCVMSAGPCIKTVNGLTVAVDITPRPLKAMHTSVFRTTISIKNRPVTDASVSINLSMPGMFMGQNIIRLTHLNQGVYEGTGVIIRCPSGKKIWQASVAISRPGRESVVNYIFEVP